MVVVFELPRRAELPRLIRHSPGRQRVAHLEGATVPKLPRGGFHSEKSAAQPQLPLASPMSIWVQYAEVPSGIIMSIVPFVRSNIAALSRYPGGCDAIGLGHQL